MEAVSIRLREDSGIPRWNEIVQMGVPLPKGSLQPGHSVALVSDDRPGESLPVDTGAMAHWEDGSVRWLRLRFLVSLGAHQSATLSLQASDSPVDNAALSVRNKGQALIIDTGTCRFELSPERPSWTTTTASGTYVQNLAIHDVNGDDCQAILDQNWTVIDQGPVSVCCESTGRWLKADGELLARFRCQLRFFHQLDTVAVRSCVHNPRRARHPGGLWDLGDPGSVHFRELSISASESESEPKISTSVSVSAEQDQPPLRLKEQYELLLYQDSSGGEHWDSPNHINAEGKVTTRFKGYRVTDACDQLASGARAQPILTMTRQGTIQATLTRFWQNFPSSLGVRGNQLTVGLFPAQASEPYELQGGERKTQTVYFHYGDNPEALTWTRCPLIPTLTPEQFEHSQAFPWFRADAPRTPLDDIIQDGLDGPANFFAKREVIDEYGWRNFGDIFADHETLYQGDNEPPLISHYNNQYDAIYGFARQFALSGDTRWFELMNDLADHVSDIDIYHTDQDRAEYNHGLFWHTDHYLPAHTATHRTFTQHNDTSSTPGQTGGGPASEHCYTTGLLYHYYLSGNADSKQSVLDLAAWIHAIHEGEGGLLEQILAFRKNELPKAKALIRGEYVNPHRHPFTRGTGNYLNTLIDAHLLEPDQRWLSLAESTIRQTIHPADNIDARDLLNVETGWSYVVFLASLARYVQRKQELSEFDDTFRYAIASFLHYATWMEHNEIPFLTKVEHLEFPNHTWAAQDVRKAMIMFQANIFSGGNRSFSEKGQVLMNEVCDTLKDSPERHFSRIQSILLQNYGPHNIRPQDSAWPMENRAEETTPAFTWSVLIKQLLKRLFRGLRSFRPSRERAWLESRLDRS